MNPHHFPEGYILIGLSGYARTGKDTVASILGEFGLQRMAVADKMREFLYQLNPALNVPRALGPITVQAVIDKHGWEGYKETRFHNPIRELLQRLGGEATSVMRNSLWVDMLLDTAPQEGNGVAVADLRHTVEAEKIVAAGGHIWRVNRAGVGPYNSHSGETELDGWDFDAVIHNNGTESELYDTIVSLLDGIRRSA